MQVKAEQELVEFTEDYLQHDDFIGAINAVNATYSQSDTAVFIKFLLNCWYDGLISNPFKKATKTNLDMKLYDPETYKQCFESTVKELMFDGCNRPHKWFEAASNFYIQDSYDHVEDYWQIPINAYIDKYQVFYSKKTNLGKTGMHFLVLSKETTIDQFVEDCKNAGWIGMAYPTNKDEWKELK